MTKLSKPSRRACSCQSDGRDVRTRSSVVSEGGCRPCSIATTVWGDSRARGSRARMKRSLTPSVCAIAAIAVPAKQLGAGLRVLPRFHGTELGIVLAQHDRLDVERLKQQDEIASRFRYELIGEEAAVADDHGERVGWHVRASLYFRAKTPN